MACLLLCAATLHAASDPPAGATGVHEHDTRTDPAFWDKKNVWLFSGVAAARFLDYHSTGNMRRRGCNEILLTNGIVDNKPLFATIEVGGSLASVGLSYLFHRTGHHRLERWTSYVHIGVATIGSARNYCLKCRPDRP